MILIEMSNREKAGIILSRTSEPTDLGPIWSVFVRKSDSKSAPKSAPKYLDRTGLMLSYNGATTKKWAAIGRSALPTIV